MKNRQKIYIFTLIAVFILLTIRGIMILLSIHNYVNEKDEYDGQLKHIIVIAEAFNANDNNQFMDGVNESADEYKIAMEYWSIEPENVEESMHEKLKKASLLKPDGIIVLCIQDPTFEAQVTELEKNGIPVITLGQDYIKAVRTSHIGYNSYDLGKQIGQSIEQLDFENKSIVVIESSTTGIQKEKQEGSNLLLGLREVVNLVKQDTLKVVYHDSNNQLGIEEVILDIFKKYPQTNLVVTLNEEDTIGAIEKLTELNIINRVKVIGYGKNKDILSYVERDIIDETIFIDDYLMGMKAMETMVSYLDKGIVSDCINVDIHVIDSNNIQEYMLKDE